MARDSGKAMMSDSYDVIAEQAADLLSTLAAHLAQRSAEDARCMPFAQRLMDLEYSPAHDQRWEPLEHPTMRFLGLAAEGASGAPDGLLPSQEIIHKLPWYQVYRGGDLDDALAEGLLAAQIVGNVGLFSSSQIRCGIFLIAPGIHYPLHTHQASELYYCLSGKLEIAHGLKDESFWLRPGKHSITPSNRLHSLTTHHDPALLLYMWMGDVDSPNWWWERQADGGWSRTRWVRSPDGSWVRTVTEPVTQDVMHEATL